MSSSQLTFMCFRGVGIPPTRICFVILREFSWYLVKLRVIFCEFQSGLSPWGDRIPFLFFHAHYMGSHHMVDVWGWNQHNGGAFWGNGIGDIWDEALLLVSFQHFSINTLWRVRFFSINIENLIMYELRRYLRHPNRVKRLETPVVLDNFWCFADGKTSRILQGI